MTAEEIAVLVNTALPIGITVGQALKHIFAAAPAGMTADDFEQVKVAALAAADADFAETAKSIESDQAQHPEAHD